MGAKDFYERRSRIAIRVEEYLLQRSQTDGKTAANEIKEFVWTLVRDEGATDGIITEMFARHGLKIQDDKLVKV